MPNKNAVVSEIDPRNQPALIAANVENRTPANTVGVRVGFPYVEQIFPLSVLCYRKP
ncbi:MAG TPA: hypothetical protein VFB23_12150 [Candidatus Acidoferrales bacterium]|jgi:hypothetical protein|nr:hypothetical protein [Candidatus Acidoferrales bacterium]